MFSLGAGAGTLQGVFLNLGELLPNEYTVLSMISVFLATLAMRSGEKSDSDRAGGEHDGEKPTPGHEISLCIMKATKM